jgi:RNA polymerase sigma-70 factor (ECF subfamily)
MRIPTTENPDVGTSELREMILLREFEELTYQEIANLLGCPIGTVMSRLARARSKLRTLGERV